MSRCGVLQRWLLCVCVTVSGLYSIQGKAGTVTNLTPGESIDLGRLLQCGDKSIQVGDKLFGDFSFSYCDKGPGCGDDLRASDVTIDASENGFGYGLSLQMPLSASRDSTEDVVFKFSVQVVDPLQQQISGVELGLQAQVAGNGYADVSEKVFTNGFCGATIADLNASSCGPTNTSVRFNKTEDIIWVEKDISVTAGGGRDNSATICSISQNFSQVPEPSGLALAGMGLLGLLLLRSYRRRNA
jgi:MYXO-CTERM domain-containing protein